MISSRFSLKLLAWTLTLANPLSYPSSYPGRKNWSFWIFSLFILQLWRRVYTTWDSILNLTTTENRTGSGCWKNWTSDSNSDRVTHETQISHHFYLIIMSNTSIHKKILDKLKWLIIDNYEMAKWPNFKKRKTI